MGQFSITEVTSDENRNQGIRIDRRYRWRRSSFPLIDHVFHDGKPPFGDGRSASAGLRPQRTLPTRARVRPDTLVRNR